MLIAHRIEGTLQPWTEGLLNTLLKLAPLPAGLQSASDAKPPPRVLLTPTTKDKLGQSTDPMDADSRYRTAFVLKNERITASDWYQDVRHFEFNFKDDVQYDPGDVAVIHPNAEDGDVSEFLELMKWSDVADIPMDIQRNVHGMRFWLSSRGQANGHISDQSLPDFLPEVSTLRTLFTRYLDFNAVPRRSFFHYLRFFTTDERELEKLDEFLSSEGADELYEYTERVRRTIAEVLTEFRNVKIPIDYILDVFPPLRPRHFSIASSVKVHPQQMHLCVAIVGYRTKLRVPRKGVCTSYLARLGPGDTLRIGLLKGLIRLPPDLETPVICVGPGTGIAPMRALIEERVHKGSRGRLTQPTLEPN